MIFPGMKSWNLLTPARFFSNLSSLQQTEMSKQTTVPRIRHVSNWIKIYTLAYFSFSTRWKNCVSRRMSFSGMSILAFRCAKYLSSEGILKSRKSLILGTLIRARMLQNFSRTVSKLWWESLGTSWPYDGTGKVSSGVWKILYESELSNTPKSSFLTKDMMYSSVSLHKSSSNIHPGTS